MRKARAAEWILSLFTRPDRAATIVGDWMEISPKNSLWLAYAVLQTSISLIWREISGHAVRLFGVAAIGLVGSIGAIVSGLVPTIVIVGMVAGTAWSEGYRVVRPETAIWGYGILVVVAIAYESGKRMAQACPGREIAVGVSFILLNLAIKLAGWLITGNSAINVSNLPGELVFNIPLIIGIVITRVHAIRRAANPA